MKKYVEKRLDDYELIEGFNLVESVIFRENGFNTPQEILEDFSDLYRKSWLAKFLNSEITGIGNQDKFVEYIQQHKGSHYCIIGDYDADGIMATTAMKIILEQYGVAQCDYIIPDRLTDGYGIKKKHVDRALTLGTEVIITVDNGITATDVVSYAKEKGLDVLITDHHIPDLENMPNADVIINPHLTDKMEHICGAMVALKLGNILLDTSIKENEYVLKDAALFAAVATISDVMPLIGENRALLKYVLDNVNYYKNKNIWKGRTLKFLAGFGVGSWLLKDENLYITEDTFGYYVGPTINASGRVTGETESIVSDIIGSPTYGQYINGYREINRERQEKTRDIFKEHIPNPEENIGFIIISADKYEYPIGGLIGLVANRISDQEQKPAFVGTEKNKNLSFSCRSVPGYSLYDGLNRFLKNNPESSVSGGGHDGAIGIRVGKTEDIELLKEHFSQDYIDYSKDIDENVFVFEDNLEKEIFDAHYALLPFGKNFRKLKFQYTGTITKYDENSRQLFIDGRPFRTFIYKDNLPENGTQIKIIFTAMTDSCVSDQFKIEELEVL